jgi:hypothetical protein
LSDRMNAGGGGLLECFFDNAWHRVLPPATALPCC